MNFLAERYFLTPVGTDALILIRTTPVGVTGYNKVEPVQNGLSWILTRNLASQLVKESNQKHMHYMLVFGEDIGAVRPIDYTYSGEHVKFGDTFVPILHMGRPLDQILKIGAGGLAGIQKIPYQFKEPLFKGLSLEQKRIVSALAAEKAAAELILRSLTPTEGISSEKPELK